MSNATTTAARSRGRTALTVVAVAAGLLGAAPGATSAAPTAAPTPFLTAFAKTTTGSQSVVAVTVRHMPAGTAVTVRGANGAVLGTAKTTPSGKALIPVTINRNNQQTARVTAAGVRGAAAVVVSTKTPYLNSSAWRMVNKRLALPSSHQPGDLTTMAGVSIAERVGAPLQKMLKDSAQDGQRIYASNAYRSYGWQRTLYSSYVNSHGGAYADAISARPGFSEHQTGLAFDAKARNEKCSLQKCFAATPEGKWLDRYAGLYGFVMRYTPTNGGYSGYAPEPWHFRYVGTWLAGYLKETKTGSLEQAFRLSPAPGYAKR